MALPLYPSEFSSRIRVDFLVPDLQRAGIDVTVRPPVPRTLFETAYGGGRVERFRYHSVEWRARIRDLVAGGNYDLVWIQKGLALFPWRGFPTLLHLFAGRTVFDLDDGILDFPPIEIPRWASGLGDRHQVKRLARAADLVLCGNRTLLEDLRGAEHNAEFLPSCIPLERYCVHPSCADPDPTLVWIGTWSNRKYLADLSPVIAGLAEDIPDLKLLVISDSLEGLDREAFGKCRLELERWSPQREAEAIARGWVGVMPLHDDEWGRRKSGYKILQYFACGLPAVASPVGVNTNLIEEGTSGHLPKNEGEWIDCLRALLKNGERRLQFGKAGRTRVEASYSTGEWAKRLASWFKGLGPRIRPSPENARR